MDRVSFSTVDLSTSDSHHIEQTAQLLFDAFRDRAAAWPDIDSARQEVLESLEPGKISRVAIDGQSVLGWIGGQPQYDGLVWELHPLVVAPHVRRRGIGRALVEDLEIAVVERGALTLWLGSDDEIDETSLSRIDLYDDLPAKLASFRRAPSAAPARAGGPRSRGRRSPRRLLPPSRFQHRGRDARCERAWQARHILREADRNVAPRPACWRCTTRRSTSMPATRIDWASTSALPSATST